MINQFRQDWMRRVLFLIVIPFWITLPFTWYFTGHIAEWTGGEFKPMAFAPKNDVLASVSLYGPMHERGAFAPIRFFSTQNGQEVLPPLTLEEMSGAGVETWQRKILKIEYSPQGDRIAILMDQVVRPLHRELMVFDLASRKRIALITLAMEPGFADFKSTLPEAIFSPDGKWVTATSSTDSERAVGIWDAENGKALTLIPGQNQPIYSPDGRLLATTPYWRMLASSTTAVKAIHLWDLESGQLHSALPLKGDVTGFGDGAVFSQDGRFVAANSRNNGKLIVEVFDVSTGKVLMSKEGWMPQFLPDGQTIQLVKGQFIQFWDSVQGTQLASRRLELGEFWQDGSPLSPYPIRVPSKPTVLVVDPKAPPNQSIPMTIASKTGVSGNNLASVFAYFACINVLQVEGPTGRLKTLRLNGVSGPDNLVWARDGNLCAMNTTRGKLSVWKFPPGKPIRFVWIAFVIPIFLLLLEWRGRRAKRRRK
jgi:hypothetical protein